MHDGSNIVWYALRGHKRRIGDFKIALSPTLNISQHDAYEHVPVRPALLMPAAQGVEYLVNNHTLRLAPRSYGDVLGATNATDERKAARSLVKAHIVLLSAAAHEPDAALSSVRVDGSLYGRAGLTVQA